MKRVLLVCGAGASSGFMAQAIRKAAKKEGIEMSVEARSEAYLSELKDSIDVLLISPHLAYMKDDILKEIEGYDIKVDVVPQMVYGMLDGKKALEIIESL